MDREDEAFCVGEGCPPKLVYHEIGCVALAVFNLGPQACWQADRVIVLLVPALLV